MSCEVQNVMELKQAKVEDVVNNSEMSKEVDSAPLSIVEKIKKFFIFFTVEPFLLCYIIPTVILAVAVQKLNIEKACRVDLNYTETICTDIVSGKSEDNITQTASDEVQTIVANMITWKDPLQSGIPAILILFVGAWSDRTGNRKALMLTPIAGQFISAIALLLATYYFLEWPLWVTGLMEAIPTAFTGGLSVAIMGSFSFIADVTSVDSRTFRIGLVGVIVTLGIPLGSALSGVLTQSIGYYGVFSIGAAFYAFGFLHTLLRIRDVNRKPIVSVSLTQKFIEFFHPKNVWNTISLLIESPRRELIQIWLIVCAHFVVMGPVFGEGVMLYIYTLTKYGMDPVTYGFFGTYSVLVGIAGTTVAVTVFSKYFSMHDALIGVIATTCKIMSSIVYGLAPTRTWFFTGPIFDFFGNSGSTVVRSLGTKVVKPDNVAKMCSLVGFVESIVPVVYTPLYSQVYALTLKTLPGAFYLLGGLMTVPAIFIFITLYIMHRRQQRDVVKNPDAKEMYACDNVSTVL